MPRRSSPLWLLPLLALLAACDVGGLPESPFDFDRFFAAPTAAELSAVEADWQARAAAGAYDPGAVAVEYEGDLLGDGSTVYVLRHTTGASAAAHYGAVRVPAGEGPFPVLVFNHGGDDGFSLAEHLAWVADAEGAPFGAAGAGAITVFPTFRSETMRTPAGLPDFASGGQASPWDRDVDDALALVYATLGVLGGRADAGRVATLGLSRGAAVSLLMAARPLGPNAPFEVAAATAYFGPTDFFSPVFRALAEPLLFQDGTVFEALPGARFFQREVLRPVLEGALSYEEGRLLGIRRSAAFFAHRLPNVQVHHHLRDGVVPFDQFTALEGRSAEIGGEAEFFAYGERGTHEARFHTFDPALLPQNLERTAAFLGRYLYGAGSALAAR